MTLPATDDIDILGGVKVNFDPVEDATTDLDADHHNIAMADIAGLTQTAPRAIYRFTGGASPADPLSGFVHAAVWGNDVSVKPTVAYTATGIFDITWPTTVDDALGEEHTTNHRFARAWVEGSATLYHANAAVTSAYVVRVRGFDASGAANALTSQTIVVEVW